VGGKATGASEIPRAVWKEVQYARAVGIPNGRKPPLAFGISTRRTGGGKEYDRILM
jgi:hypothetical protein